MESRIAELEMKFMHQESTIEELNEVVVGQQKTLDRLTREVELLKQRLKEVRSPIVREPSEEPPPPHY
jgi:SlyX protein